MAGSTDSDWELLSDPRVKTLSIRLVARLLGMERRDVRKWAREARILTRHGISKQLVKDRFPITYQEIIAEGGGPEA